LIIVALAGWFWGVPSREKKHDQVIYDIPNCIRYAIILILSGS